MQELTFRHNNELLDEIARSFQKFEHEDIQMIFSDFESIEKLEEWLKR
jgi:hypothetical protein